MSLMCKLFKPDLYLDSISDLNVGQLKEKGIGLLLLDLDNTLANHGGIRADNFALREIRRIEQEGIKCVIFSNAISSRAKSFAESAGIEHIPTPAKPSKIGIKKVFKKHPEFTNEMIAIIGDQIFTDVLAGKRSNIFTILVDPLSLAEKKYIGIRRRFERYFKKKLELCSEQDSAKTVEKNRTID